MATTDLAAVRFPSSCLGMPIVCCNFVDARQSLHFQQIFTLSRKGGLVKLRNTTWTHPFGNRDGLGWRPFKTRSRWRSEIVRLIGRRRKSVLINWWPTKIQTGRRGIWRKHWPRCCIASVSTRICQKTVTAAIYVFNWDTMLSFEGKHKQPYLSIRIFSRSKHC